jgi:hypothetical protein
VHEKEIDAIYVGDKFCIQAQGFKDLIEQIIKAITMYSPADARLTKKAGRKGKPRDDYKTECNNAAEKAKALLFPPGSATWGIYMEGCGRPFHTVRYGIFRSKQTINYRKYQFISSSSLYFLQQ